MKYDEWEAGVPEQIRADSLWRVEAYRLGLFLSDLGRADARRVMKERLMRNNADQLYRATSNISSNISEGFSRSSHADRARFFEYALGSVREARDWYYKVRPALPQRVNEHRVDLTTQLTGLLIAMVNNERKRSARISKATNLQDA